METLIALQESTKNVPITRCGGTFRTRATLSPAERIGMKCGFVVLARRKNNIERDAIDAGILAPDDSSHVTQQL